MCIRDRGNTGAVGVAGGRICAGAFGLFHIPPGFVKLVAVDGLSTLGSGNAFGPVAGAITAGPVDGLVILGSGNAFGPVPGPADGGKVIAGGLGGFVGPGLGSIGGGTNGGVLGTVTCSGGLNPSPAPISRPGFVGPVADGPVAAGPVGAGPVADGGGLNNP